MATSIKIVGQPVTWTISDLAAQSQQIPIPATTAGNALMVCIASNETTAANNVTSVADSASNTWTQRGSTQSSGTGAGHVATQIYMATGSTVSATWFKVTPNANLKQVTVTFFEIAGLTASPVDVNNGGTVTSATTVTASNTPTTLGDVIVFFAATGGQSLAHTNDGTANVAMVGAPYSAGTAGAGVVSDVTMFVGATAAAMTTSWTSAATGNFAWSSISLKASTPGTGGLRLVASGDPVSAADVNQFTNLLNGTTMTIPMTVANRIQASLTGATAPSGFVGGTTSGNPVSGSFLVGDMILDQTGCVRVCITAGSPGTWQRVGIGNYVARAYQASPQSYSGSSSLFTVTTDTASGSGGFDPKSMFNLSDNGFVIPFSGSKWRLISSQHISVTGNGRFASIITVNGTEVSRGYDGPTSSGKGGGVVSDIQSLNSGDIVRAAIVSTATGNTVGGTSQNYLAIALADG